MQARLAIVEASIQPQLLASIIIRGSAMITCYLRYEIDPSKIKEFEAYAKMWIPLVNRLGGTHHGYFLPHESSNYIALAMFSFPSLEAYAGYRSKAAADPQCRKAVAYAQETRCFLKYEREFFRPVVE